MATVAATPRPSKRPRTTSKALTLDQLPNDPAELQSKLLELSGNVLSEALEMLLKVTRKERVLFSVDTPFNNSKRGWDFLQEVAERGVFETEGELDGFAFGNAVALLGLQVDVEGR